MQRPSSCACQDHERWCANHGDKVEREEEDKFSDLAEGERAVDCGFGGLAKHFYGIWSVGEEDSRRGNEGGLAFVDERCLCEKEELAVDRGVA